MIAIVGKVNKDGQTALDTVLVPSNHSEATGINTWGLVIAGGLLLAATTLVCLMLFAA